MASKPMKRFSSSLQVRELMRHHSDTVFGKMRKTTGNVPEAIWCGGHCRGARVDTVGGGTVRGRTVGGTLSGGHCQGWGYNHCGKHIWHYLTELKMYRSMAHVFYSLVFILEKHMCTGKYV